MQCWFWASKHSQAKKFLKALIRDSSDFTIKCTEACSYAKRLVDEIEITRSAKEIQIILKQQISFGGTLSDAKGPVEAEVRGQTVRIRYVMKGNIKVEQELTAQPGGRAVINRGTFRKFGMKVAIMKERIDKR